MGQPHETLVMFIRNRAPVCASHAAAIAVGMLAMLAIPIFLLQKAQAKANVKS